MDDSPLKRFAISKFKTVIPDRLILWLPIVMWQMNVHPPTLQTSTCANSWLQGQQLSTW